MTKGLIGLVVWAEEIGLYFWFKVDIPWMLVAHLHHVDDTFLVVDPTLENL